MGDGQVVVVTDSSAHIPQAALAGLRVSVIPVWLIWEGERLRDGVDIDPETFYRRLRTARTLPGSSQPSPGEFLALFHRELASAEAVVCVLVSAKMSGTIASAQAACKEFGDARIHIVDSRSGSMGHGFAVLAAARAAAAGRPAEEVVAAAEAMREQVHFLFVVDTLEYLHRGGRIGGATRLLGTALDIKPILHFNEGQIEPLCQARTRRRAIERVLDIAEERLAGRPMAEAAVVDIDAVDVGDAVAGMVAARFGPPLIHRAAVSPVVGSHVGPGAIGLAFHCQPGR